MTVVRLKLVVFFFFQAEDGIRDWSVTGVQTCALPICLALQPAECARVHDTVAVAFERRARTAVGLRMQASARRSEERRVGKECRSRGAEWDLKKKRGGQWRIGAGQ